MFGSSPLETVGLIVGILGLSCMLAALGMLSATAPQPTWNPARWSPIWKQRDHFTSRGWKIWTCGISALVIGVALRLSAMLL